MTKYMMSIGLAYSEARDMEKLRKKALQGWNLKRFRFAGYELERGQSEDVIFSIDYRLLTPDEEEEYFDMFAYAGWTHVCSEYNMHIFKASKGTIPIYSDAESSNEKIERSAVPIQTVIIYSGSLTIISALLMKFTSGVIQTVSKGVFTLSLIVVVPMVMTLLATYYHRWKKKN